MSAAASWALVTSRSAGTPMRDAASKHCSRRSLYSPPVSACRTPEWTISSETPAGNAIVSTVSARQSRKIASFALPKIDDT